MTDRTDRGVSTVVSYVLVLGIVALLASTLVGAFGPFVTNQQQAAAQSTMKVLGNDLAADVESADRLAAAGGGNGTVVLRTRLPEAISGSPYEIEIDPDGGSSDLSTITLRVDDFEAQSTVAFRTDVQVVERTGADALDGGDLRIVYDPDAAGGPRLVIENA